MSIAIIKTNNFDSTPDQTVALQLIDSTGQIALLQYYFQPPVLLL